jgi:hypothetical protein
MRRLVLARGLTCALGLALSLPPHSSPHAEPPDRGLHARKPTRLRRANTTLGAMDKIIVRYEDQLRETATLEKLFKYFSSLVVNGREVMLPIDMVRAITPGVPPAPQTKPINVPLFETSLWELEQTITEQESPKFFRYGEDLGLISYGRFIFYVALLAIPARELRTCYFMSTGRSFADQALRGDGLKAENLDFILSKHVKTRTSGYDKSHSRTSIFRHIFGKDLEKSLSFEEFEALHSNLWNEVLKLEYFLLSDRTEESKMSLVGFARAVAALTPAEYRTDVRARAEALRGMEIPPEFLVEKEPLLGEPYNPPLESLKGMRADDYTVSFEEWAAWKETLKAVEHLESAVKLYSHQDGHLTVSNLRRAAAAVGGNVSKPLAWVLFQLFDADRDGILRHDDFVRLLSRHSALRANLKGPEGLGLDLLAECASECCKHWYDGTLESKKSEAPAAE